MMSDTLRCPPSSSPYRGSCKFASIVRGVQRSRIPTPRRRWKRIYETMGNVVTHHMELVVTDSHPKDQCLKCSTIKEIFP